MVDKQTAAASLAAQLHGGQVDKAGRPYLGYLMRVVANLQRLFPDASPPEIEVAWLHDALEDTSATAANLLSAGVSAAAVGIVQEVTRPGGSVYLDWIADMARSGSLSAVRVKLADNEDNRDPERVALLPAAADLVRKRYEPARRLLQARIDAGV